MKIRALGYDSGGQPGVTAQAYAAHRRWRKAGKARKLGVIGGREVWTIIPTKGAKPLEAKRLTVTYPDTSTAANKAAARGEVPVAIFNPNQFKDDLAGQLQVAEPGPGYVHFPAALKSRAEPHVWFEQLVSEHQLPNGRWEKISPHAKQRGARPDGRNHVVAHLHGLSRASTGPTRRPGPPTGTRTRRPRPRRRRRRRRPSRPAARLALADRLA
jgi:phage terminase large subunit GpA-like protein